MRRRLQTIVDVLRSLSGVLHFRLAGGAEVSAHENDIAHVRAADIYLQMGREGVPCLPDSLAGGT